MEQAYLTGVVTERPKNFAWFLGAGASRSAGLPTATDIIWELKRQFFTKEEGERVTRQDVQIAAVKDRIQSFMLSRGFPQEGDPAEYETYFEKIFGSDRERQRAYMVRVMNEENATLSVGNRVMGALLGADFCKVAFTTNFDSIVEKAVAETTGRSLSAFHVEGARASLQALNNNEFPLYCKLHGDYRYDSIKNLKDDLAAQNKELGDCFRLTCTRFGFIVSGYSGRDASVISLFRDALDGPNPFPHGLYWTGIKGDPVSSVVAELIEYAKTKNVSAHYVGIETYDALMLRIWRNLRASDELDAKVRKKQASSVRIELPPAGVRKPPITLNALPIVTLPTQCQKLVFARDPDWKSLKEMQRASEGTLILTKADGVWCWGSAQGAKQFCKPISGIENLDFSERLPNISDNLQLKGFLEEALCKALAKEKPLLARSQGGRYFVIVDAHASDQSALSDLNTVAGKPYGKVAGLFAPADEFHSTAEQVHWAEALRISLEEKAGRYWLIINPDIWIWPARARRLATDFMNERRKDRLNKKFNALLNAWIPVVLGQKGAATTTVSAFASGAPHENPAFEISSDSATSFGRSA